MPSSTPLPFTLALAALAASCAPVAVAPERARLERIVNEAILPLLAEHDLPGLAVALTIDGERHLFHYGVASRGEPARAVTRDTLFEIGSVTKTFTAALVCYAEAVGALSLEDPASKHWPALQGSSFDVIRLLELATYTAGGLPLQLPDEVQGEETLLAYLRAWRPAHPPGTQRLYSNPSIGLFGHLAARSLGRPYEDLLQNLLLPQLGLHQTFVRVPPARLADYAQGHRADGSPIRVAPGVLDAETYGLKTTASDLLRFVEAHLEPRVDDPALQRALTATHAGYFALENFVQGLGWDLFADPVTLDTLLAGNSPQVLFEPNAVTELTPPQAPREDLLLQKTGSTNGFGAYVAFVPARRFGIVLLANKSYPIPARVRAAYQILLALDAPSARAANERRGD
ncbi:MAG: beta-lactamase [Planctomycetes bacterium]|nr:beta-lactamase [Planctomycetota bacterium]